MGYPETERDNGMGWKETENIFQTGLHSGRTGVGPVCLFCRYNAVETNSVETVLQLS